MKKKVLVSVLVVVVLLSFVSILTFAKGNNHAKKSKNSIKQQAEDCLACLDQYEACKGDCTAAFYQCKQNCNGNTACINQCYNERNTCINGCTYQWEECKKNCTTPGK